MVSISEALDFIDKIDTFNKIEVIPIQLAVNRVIAQDIFVKYDLPSFNSSAMDGYGVTDDFEKVCKVLDTILAGDMSNIDRLEKNEAIKIMTGAKVPDCIKKVIPIENVKVLEDDTIEFEDFENLPSFSNIRLIGEDLKKDTLIISQSQLLNASHLAILASSGISHIKVYKKLEVAILATGSEIKLHFESIKDGQVYDTNSIYLMARLQELGCNVTLLDKRVDNLEDIQKEIEGSLHYDIVITTGGASVGDADFVKKAFENLDVDYYFNKVNIKPGRPVSLGKISSCYVLGLGGNPFAMSITFEVFGKPLVQKLQKQDTLNIKKIKAKLRLEIKASKPMVIAGYYDGDYFDYIHNQKPSRVGVLNNCNSYMIIEESKQIQKDEFVDIFLYC
jgi:molybdopterin molybdotransferase